MENQALSSALGTTHGRFMIAGRSCRCRLHFISRNNLLWKGIDPGLRCLTMGTCLVPLFDQLYNFDRWLTWKREGAEDLVQETYAKALKGVAFFRLGTNSGCG